MLAQQLPKQLLAEVPVTEAGIDVDVANSTKIVEK
jgi:hypothetical protein